MSAYEDLVYREYQARLVQAVEPLRIGLQNHAVYTRLNSLWPLRLFMEAHVFAVWDFMCLVKTLQQRLTTVTTPWLPPSDPFSARLINDIVLVEESDQVDHERYGSHFELYLVAMEEVGASTRSIRSFLRAIGEGRDVADALIASDASPTVRGFVMNTMATIQRGTHEVAASFLLGRETVIPLMFEQVLKVTSHLPAPMLNWYLDRHITVDSDEHGPAGWRLLSRLCGPDETRWREAEVAAKRALHSRRVLWDGVCSALRPAAANPTVPLPT
jgi:hypothetical protein